MAKITIKAGSTSQRFIVFVPDSSKTDGSGLSGLTSATSGLKWYYWRPDTGNSGGVAVTLASSTLGTYTSGSFKEVDATNLKGFYEVGVPDAAIASTNTPKWCVMSMFGAANMAVVNVEMELVLYDPEDSVRLGLTSLPNAAASAIGGLPLAVDTSGRVDVLKINGTSQTARDIGASVLISSGTGTGQLSVSAGVISANATQWLGSAISSPNISGIPKVDVVDWGGVATNALVDGRVESVTILRSGTCQAGPGPTNALKLDASASSTNDIYTGAVAFITSGLAAGQARQINSYNGTTKTCLTNGSYSSAPDVTSKFAILPYMSYMGGGGLPLIDIGQVQGNPAISSINGYLDVNVTSLAAGLYTVKKNTTLTNYAFAMFDSTTNELKTGLTVAVAISKNGGSFATATNSPATEIGTTGVYTITLTSTEMNADQVFVKATSSGAHDMPISLLTQA